MYSSWNRIATCVSTAICISLLALGGCSGGGGTSSSLPSQPSQEQNPGQLPATPSTSASPTPPNTTTSNVRIYAINPNLKIVLTYDEEGHPIANCPFPNLVNPIQIAFDNSNQRLYFSNAGPGAPVLAFDLNGNPIKTPGAFPGAGAFITFDSNNRRLYTFTGGKPTAAVFDEGGNPVTVSGTFDNSEEAVAVAFDPFNRQIYAGNITGAGVLVFDEQGNAIPFPAISSCDGISALAFDAHNRHFYIAGPLTPTCGPPSVTVFDEAGNVVKTTGTFPNVVAPTAMTFDVHNNRLYVLNLGSITVYDEEGHQITTSGTFPNAAGASIFSGMVAAPQ